eukprot:2313689-Prymnesium_polylepis.1
MLFSNLVSRTVEAGSLSNRVDSYRSAAPSVAELELKTLCEMCRSVLFAKRPPPRVFALHRSRRVSTSTSSDLWSATPPPAASLSAPASCDDAVALASAIVTLD